VVVEGGCLPLHLLAKEGGKLSSGEDELMMIGKHPEVVEAQDQLYSSAFHTGCKVQRRSSIISRCIELYPEALAHADEEGDLPLHWLLDNNSSTTEDALAMIEKYPAAVEHHGSRDELPIHVECQHQCRSAIISKCIELYPESLALPTFVDDEQGDLPLHLLFENELSSTNTALMMIEKYPVALQKPGEFGNLPIFCESKTQCRADIISKCIELYPESLDNGVISRITIEVGENFRRYVSGLSIIFAARPMSLYDRYSYRDVDIRADSAFRRCILRLLPHRVFTPTHDADYRDLNWQPRAAMMMLLSQMKIKQRQSKVQQGPKPPVVMLLESLLAKHKYWRGYQQQQCL
jgi:hypothetical protein